MDACADEELSKFREVSKCVFKSGTARKPQFGVIIWCFIKVPPNDTVFAQFFSLFLEKEGMWNAQCGPVSLCFSSGLRSPQSDVRSF